MNDAHIIHSEEINLLPGEGDVQKITKTRVRHECEICGEPATKKHTFLLDGARRNPASSAYGMDDCTWCSDSDSFSCDEHELEVRRNPPNGHGWCSTFTLHKGYEHMFLYWRELIDE